MGPTKGRLFKLDFPSAKFWVKIFFVWVGLRAKRPPPLPIYNQSLAHCWGRAGVSARFRSSEPAGVIAATATGGLQHGCHATVRGLSKG